MTLGYTQMGSGAEKVLVFEGWFGDYSVWEPTFKGMDTDTFTYLFMDYRGYGKSATQSGSYSMHEIAADALALVQSLGWTELHVVGHSMGGMAMQRFALDTGAGIRVKSAVGVTPVPASGGELNEKVWPLFFGAISNDDNRHAIIDFTTGNRLSPAWIKRMVAASRATTQEAAYAGYLHAWALENFSDEISRIRHIPVLACVGEHDKAITAEGMQATYAAWYDTCEVAVIGNAGHYPMQETPLDLITRMETFMRKHA